MKIDEFKVGAVVHDSWGNSFIVNEILKTRVKLKAVRLEQGYMYGVLNLGDIITYDKQHLQFLKNG